MSGNEKNKKGRHITWNNIKNNSRHHLIYQTFDWFLVVYHLTLQIKNGKKKNFPRKTILFETSKFKFIDGSHFFLN